MYWIRLYADPRWVYVTYMRFFSCPMCKSEQHFDLLYTFFNVWERDVALRQERSLMVRSILRGGPIELFLVSSNAPRLWCVLSRLWGGAYKRAIAAYRKE